MNYLFLNVRFQRFQQLHANQHQQEVPKNLEQALYRYEPPWRLRDLLPYKGTQVHRGKDHDHSEHRCQRQYTVFLDLADGCFHRYRSLADWHLLLHLSDLPCNLLARQFRQVLLRAK